MFRGWCCMSSGGCTAPLALPDGTLATARSGHPAGVRGHPSNAMGNFCFDVTLGYRRVERPRCVADES